MVPFRDLIIARKFVNRCLPTMRYLFIYDTVVVNLGHFSLLMLKLK
jgi:hypothetical protein